MEHHENHSEVARMRQNIELENEAAERGLNGYAITARLENIGAALTERKTQVGVDQAVREAWAELDAFADEVAKTMFSEDTTTSKKDEQTEQKGRRWLYMIFASHPVLHIDRLHHTYATTQEEAEAFTAAWRQKKKDEGFTEQEIVDYPGGYTVGNTRTLPGYINADGTTGSIGGEEAADDD